MSDNFPYLSVAVNALVKRAQARNLEFAIEKSTGYCGTIICHNRVIAIHGADIGLNTSASARISNDKFFTENFLRENGLNGMDSRLIRGTDPPVNPMPGLPFVVKPNTGFGGQGFSLVKHEKELIPAIERAAQIDNLILIQPFFAKRECRIVILDGELLYAYERFHWKIVGDGETSVAEFLQRKNLPHLKSPKFNLQDSDLLLHLQQKGIALDYVLKQGESIRLFDNTNLTKGGGFEPIRELHPHYVQRVAKAAKKIGLRYAGVDLFCDSPEEFDGNYRIIEVNANPGFEYLRNNPQLMESVFDKIAIALFD